MSNCVYASSGSGSSFIDKYEYFNDKIEHWFSVGTGLIFSPVMGVYDYFRDHLISNSSDYGISDTSDTGIENWISNNYSIDQSDNSITVNSTLINAMRDCAQDYVDSQPYVYGYDYIPDDFLNGFIADDPNNYQNAYDSFEEIIDTYSNDHLIICCFKYDGVANHKPNDVCVFNTRSIWFYDPQNGFNNSFGFKADWTFDKTNSGFWDIYKYFSYDSGTNSYVESNDNLHRGEGLPHYRISSKGLRPQSLDDRKFYTSSEHNQHIVYRRLVDIPVGSGSQSYYVTDSFNTENISDSFNTSVTEIDNSITLGDIDLYIDQYKDDHNGSEPDINNIYIYINNWDPTPTPTPSPSPTPTPDPDDPSGGGGSGDGGNIWDFLSTIGEVLGNLISGLGQILAGLLSAISSIITSLKDGIPNTIGLFLEWFFPFLPEEIIALINLSILCMVLVGVVRLIRGS